jgi:hypothetical protein
MLNIKQSLLVMVVYVGLGGLMLNVAVEMISVVQP